MSKFRSRHVLTAAALACAASQPAFAADWPSGFSKCADQGGTCAAGSAVRQVSFGIKNQWVIQNLSGNIACTVATFGSDPYPGLTKKCAVGPVAAPAPSPAPAPAPSPAPAPAPAPSPVPAPADRACPVPTLPSGVVDAASLTVGLHATQINALAGVRTYSAAVAIDGKHSPSNYRAAPALPGWQFANADPTGGVLGFECQPAPANGWHGFARVGGNSSSAHKPVLVTGGMNAAKSRVYTVFTKEQLLNAVNEGRNEPKIIRVVGHVDFRWDNGSFREYTGFVDQKQGGSLQIPSNTTLVGIDVNGQPARLTGTQLLVGAEMPLAAGGDAEADFKAWVAAGKNADDYPTWTRNVIIRNLQIDTPWDVNPEDSGNAYMDGMTISRAQQVWVDHIAISDGDTPDSLASDTRHDGGLDIVRGSDYVTVSGSYFAKHGKLTLVGNGDSGRAWSDAGRLHVTFTGNWWDSINSRQPLARFGQVHLYNNLITGSTSTSNADVKFGSALNVRYKADVISENNFYDFIGLKPSQVCGKLAAGKDATSFRSSGHRFISDKGDDGKPMAAIIDVQLQGCDSIPVLQLWTPPYAYTLRSTDSLRTSIKTSAGPGKL